jgi:rubrerythrin
MGTESALKAMRSNEKLTNRTYDNALDLEMPADVRAVVSGNRDDERRHLEFIERCLEQRLWETGGTQPPAA